MQGVIVETSPGAVVSLRGKVPEAAWSAPLGTGRLFALLFLTSGAYSLFYMYKVARDLRDHADDKVTPWLYPLSILIGLANAIAGGRLANLAAGLATPQQRKASCTGAIVGALIFVAHVTLTIVDRVTMQSLFVPGLLLFTVPWLLIEHQLNAVKVGLPNASYRGRAYRFSKLQWSALALGIGLWALILIGLWQDVVRWRGTELAAGVAYVDPQDRFSITPSRDGWLIVAPGAVVDDAELELLGPGPSDWAVAHVTEQAGWELDTVVDNRYTEISTMDENVQFTEKRELVPGTNTVLSYTTYRGNDAIDGSFVFNVAAFVTEHRAVELIVYSAGVRRSLSGGDELARSLKPSTTKESALAE